MKVIATKLFIFSATFIFTAFVFANTYEVVFNRDIAFATSVERSANQTVIDAAVKDFETRLSSDASDTAAAMEQIDRLEFPALQSHLSVEESRRISGSWYARPSSAHYVGLNKNTSGVTVDYLLYAVKSWRTLPTPERIEQGMEVIVYHRGASSVMQVAEKKILPLDRSLLVSKTESRQILLVIEDPDAGIYYGFSLESKV